MDSKKYSKKDKQKLISMLIGVIALSIILTTTLTTVINQTKNKGKTARKQEKELKEQENKILENYDSEMLAVVLDIDGNKSQIRLFDIDKEEERILYYSGSSDIRDKFDQISTINRIPIGVIVDVAYRESESKLIKMRISTDDAWEYVGVNNFEIDKSKMSMRIAQRQYRYTDDILVVDEGKTVSISHIARQDQLTVWGKDETIWSIIVSKGHGSLRLENYEDFIGGKVTVGRQASQEITDSLIITAREGTHNLIIENEDYSVRKSVTINRNEETVVSLEDIRPEAIRESELEFNISPSGADLFIDDKLTSYEEPVKLAYGEYKIRVSLGGYKTYEGTINVDEPNIRKGIHLPEIESQEEISVDEDESPVVKAEQYMYVQTPVGASIYLNGEFLGISPGRFIKNVGKHVITFIKEGYETMSYTIQILDDGLDTYINMPELEPY